MTNETFLRSCADADVRVLQWSAPTPELIFVPEFAKRGPGQHSYRLWNTAFPWKPEIAQWEPDKVLDPILPGLYYLKNTPGTPLVEYTREPFDNPSALVHGRVYWNTDFAIYTGPPYDAALFGRWFDKIVRWLRKRGNRVELTKGWYQYWLPGAWNLRNASTRDHVDLS